LGITADTGPFSQGGQSFSKVRKVREAPTAPEVLLDQRGLHAGRGGRSAAVVAALLVGLAGIAFAVRAFRGAETPPRPAATVQNGLIAFASGFQHVYVVRPDGTGLKAIWDVPVVDEAGDVKTGDVILGPWEWSPDGRRLACVGYAYDPESAGANYDVFVMNADGTGLANLTTSPQDIADGTSQWSPRWSPDGTKIAFGSDNGLFLASADGSGLIKLADGGSPSWSPDGTRIAFVATGKGNEPDIFTARPDGTGLTNVTSDPGWEDVPVWSPDGSRLAFLGNTDGEKELYVVNSDGSGLLRLTDAPTNDLGGYSPTWSPGPSILLEAYDHGNWDLYLVDPDGAGWTQLTDSPGDEIKPVWSPDGTSVAFMGSPLGSPSGGGDNAGTFDVYTINPGGTGETRITHVGGSPGSLAWQPIPAGAGSPTTTPTEVAAPHVVATIQVGDEFTATSLAVGYGSLWVSISSTDGSETPSFVRIDPRTNDIIARIAVDAVPGWDAGGSGMAMGGGAVWVTGAVPTPGQPPGSGAILQRVDPSVNEAVATIPLGGESGADVAVDDTGVWVSMFDTDGSTEVARIDPTTDQVVARIPLEAEWVREIFAADGVVLVHTLNPGGLIVIDPATNRVIANELDGPTPLAQREGVVWAALDRALVRIDPSTAQSVGDPIPLDRDVRPDGLALGEGGLWFVGFDGRDDTVPTTIDRVELGSGLIDVSVEVAGNPLDIALSPRAVWVLRLDGSLLRIDLP
jgi:hypothetical protein